MAYDVFISHSNKDKAVADATCARLEHHGIRCWIAPRDIAPGAKWGGAIVKAIRGCRVMVLIFSSHTNASEQILREVERAVNAGVTIMPMRIEDVMPKDDLDYFLSAAHWLDAFSPPLDQHLDKLAKAILEALPLAPPQTELAAAAPEAELESPSHASTGYGSPRSPGAGHPQPAPAPSRAARKSLAMPIMITLLVLAASGALGWYFGIEKPAEENANRLAQQEAEKERRQEIQQAAEAAAAKAKADADAAAQVLAAAEAKAQADQKAKDEAAVTAAAQAAADQKARDDAAAAQAVADAQAKAQADQKARDDAAAAATSAQAAADQKARDEAAIAQAKVAAAAAARAAAKASAAAKAAAASATPPPSLDTASRDYDGTIGTEKCTVTLAWVTETRVTGTLKTDSAQLDLSGSNLPAGQLDLNASSDGSAIGTVSLQKNQSPGSGAITWSGTFQPIKGDALQVSFSRTSDSGSGPSAPAPLPFPPTEKNYSGTLGQVACQVGLTWGGNDSLTGYLAAGGTTYTVTGDNATVGQLNLIVKDRAGTTMTATVTKKTEGPIIVWSGPVQLSDGSTTSLSFSHAK